MRGALALALVCIVGLAAQSLAQQYDILPGVEFLGRGWNSQSDEFGRSVVRLRYDRKAWIRSPFDNERYSVPDALSKGGVRLAQAFKEYKNDVYSSTHEYVNAKGNEFGIGLKVPGLFEFSTSRIKRRMNSFLNSTSRMYGVTGERHQYWRITAPPPEIFSMDLDEDFMTLLDRTGWVFNAETQKRWFTIFEYWGTHYANILDLGGFVNMETRLDTSRLRTEDITYIKNQITISLGAQTTPNVNAPATPTALQDPTLNLVPDVAIPVFTIPNPDISGGGGGGKRSQLAVQSGGPISIPGINWGVSFSSVKEQYNKMLSDEFKSAASASIHLIGGEHYDTNPDQWRDWVPTIHLMPEVISKRLRPISELFDEPGKVAVWEQALEAYRNWWVSTDQGSKVSTDPWSGW